MKRTLFGVPRGILGFRRPMALVFAVALAIAPAVMVVSASAATSSPSPSPGTSGTVATTPAADTTHKCKPDVNAKDDNDNDNGDDDDNNKDDHDDNDCPPPVVPEAPMAVLLPISAGVVLSVAYFVTRRRVDPTPE